MGKCINSCGRNASKYGEIAFNHDGYAFKIVKLGAECEQCTTKEFLKNFETFHVRLIKDKKGMIVDWNFYFGVYNNDFKQQLNEILIALGILDHKSKGNWEIAGNGVILNPVNLGESLYFTRRKDVLEYEKIRYGRPHYFCEIRKISEVIDKEKFSKV